MKEISKSFDFIIGKYTRVSDVVLIRFFNYRFYQRVGNVYKIFGFVFGNNKSSEMDG